MGKWCLPAVLLCAVALVGCSKTIADIRARALRAAEAGGFNSPVITDEHWNVAEFYGCSKGDDVAFDMSGMGRGGKPLEAVVCCGGVTSLKGCTFRVK